MNSFDSPDPIKNCYFINGCAGTGKTFCYSVLTHLLQARGKKVISVAWTGIASILLINGRRSKSTFQIPLVLNDTSTSSMSMSSKKARVLRENDLIIWDEAPMAPLHAFNVTDRLFQK